MGRRVKTKGVRRPRKAMDCSSSITTSLWMERNKSFVESVVAFSARQVRTTRIMRSERNRPIEGRKSASSSIRKSLLTKKVVFRQYVCPGCSTLIENEVVLASCEPVWDKRLGAD